MSFTYRGTTSDSMFFNVTERQVYNAPAFDVNAIEVPGRSGDVLNSQQRFKNKTLVYTGFIRSSDFPGNTQWERLSRGLRNIKAWICGDAGKYHDLTDDYDPGFIRRAFVSGETAINILFDRPDGATITITFLAEPFMYEVSEPIEVPESDTASGSIATFEGVDAPLKSLVFNIEPVQSGSGDPSPTNIRPISGWTQVNVVAAGVNLLDSSDCINDAFLAFLAVENNFATVTAIAGASVYYAKVKPNTTYTLSHDNGDRNIICGYSSVPTIGAASNNVLSNYGTAVTPKTFTTGANDTYVAIYVNRYATSKPTKIQLEKGSTASPYAAPTLTPITIPLGQTVYGGTLDVLRGKLAITRKTITIDGSQNVLSSSSNRFFISIGEAFKVDSSNQLTYAGVTSDRMKPMSWGTLTDDYVVGDSACCGPVYGNGIAFRWNNITTAADWKTYFTNNPTQFTYELATPIEVDLTPVSVNSLLGQNNIWCNTGETEVGYIVPTENPTQWPSQPRLEITMSGAGTLTVNGKTWSIGAYTGTLICDSEIMDWYDAGALKNSLVSGDGFPEFVPGDNVITYTGGITKVVATPRWRTL